MVDQRTTVDVSCQTEDWDDAKVDKYDKMKTRLINLLNQQKTDLEALDKAHRRIKTLENSRQKKSKMVTKASTAEEPTDSSSEKIEDRGIRIESGIEIGEDIDQLDEDDEIDVPAPKRPRFTRRKRMSVQRDENGNVVLPQQVASMNVISLGKVDSTRPSYHTARYIFPIGYHVERLYMSTVNPDAQTTYTCKVKDGGKGPLFTLTSEDDPSLDLSARTATSAWATVIKKANEVRKRESANAISGPEYYGFSHPLIIEMIEDLDGVDECVNYCRRITK